MKAGVRCCAIPAGWTIYLTASHEVKEFGCSDRRSCSGTPALKQGMIWTKVGLV
jgi:hypothetical protein